jgi:uncharacterized protein (TIGR00369 family)
MAPPVHAERFAPLPPEKQELWRGFPERTEGHFPSFVGLVLEEVRSDYARFRLPYRAQLDQPGGVVHGGALATLVDTAVVPAVASAYDEFPRLLTVNMVVQYLGSVVKEDAVAEAWVQKRGRSTVFCRVEVHTHGGDLAATADLVYAVRPAAASSAVA